MTSLTVLSPVAGTVVALADVPDPVFAEGMVGPGIAVDPEAPSGGGTPPGAERPSDVVAPCDGRLVKLHPHAFVVVADAGHGVLAHLGIDTVQLAGDGFTLHAAEGDTVVAGQRLISWFPRAVSDGGRSPLVPVVALDAPQDTLELLAAPNTRTEPGAPLFRLP